MCPLNFRPQTSILRFIEDNWLSGQRVQPGGSFDTIAGPLNNMFDFDQGGDRVAKLVLDPATGAVVSASGFHGNDRDDDHRDGDRH